tara:strand:+ start:299 stop:1327 length:1029 start_codon:yes stop_codon:yes gene_type:complete
MKLSTVSNYKDKGYINESSIFNELYSTLGITSVDTFEYREFNAPYLINSSYTHLIVAFDYKTTSLQLYTEFLKEITIPKVFIVDTIPEKHRELNKEFVDTFLPNFTEGYTGLTKQLQSIIYEDYGDAFVFFSEKDKSLFDKYYKVSKSKPRVVIPPPLGPEESIKANTVNTSGPLVYNGVPSYANGLVNVGDFLHRNNNLHMDMYGTHGRLDLNNEILVNDLLSNLDNFKFKARVRKDADIFNKYSVYLHLPKYDSFDYFCFKSLLNGSIPVVSKNSTFYEYLAEYPFVCTSDPANIDYTFDILAKTSIETLNQVIKTQVDKLKELSNENTLKKYVNLIENL